MHKKNKYTKEVRYSILKTILRVVTLSIAITALVIAIQAKSEANFVSEVQSEIIQKLLFANQ